MNKSGKKRLDKKGLIRKQIGNREKSVLWCSLVFYSLEMEGRQEKRRKSTMEMDNVASVLLLAGVTDGFSPAGWWAPLARVLYALHFSLSRCRILSVKGI